METNKSKEIKMSFVTYFDGCRWVEKRKDIPSTYEMGICKLEYKEKENELTVYLRRPGLLIGYHGETIKATEKYLGCKIKIVEVNLID